MLNRIRNYEFRIDLSNFDFMEKKRKILLVAKKYSFKEAEEADDKFWSEQSAEYRLWTLMDLRETVFGNIKNQSIKKVVYKRSLHEEVET